MSYQGSRNAKNTSFNITTTIENKNYYYPNFANEETGIQGVK